MARSGLETIIIKLRRKMLISFKKQFKFTIHKRNNMKRKYYKKIVRDELITVFEYTHQLLNCRRCELWKKSYLTSKRHCMECVWDTRQHKTHICVDWDGWGGKAA